MMFRLHAACERPLAPTSTERPQPDTLVATDLRVPTCWEVTWNVVRRLVNGPLASPPPNAKRDTLVLDAAVALRGGRVEDASNLLSPHSGVLTRDAAYLNLLGVVCEARRQWTLARRFYGFAISVNSKYAPAQQNMRRLYELYTFGRSRVSVALGDGDLRFNRALDTHDHQ